MKNNLFGQLACIGMLAGLSPFAEARIGETKAECIARYGEGSEYPAIKFSEQFPKLSKSSDEHSGETTPEETDEHLLFNKLGYQIVIGFKDDLAVHMQYLPGDNEWLISKEELYSILLANGGDKKWIMYAEKMFPFSPPKPDDPFPPKPLLFWTDNGDLRATCQLNRDLGFIVILKSNLLPRFAPKLTEQHKELVQGL